MNIKKYAAFAAAMLTAAAAVTGCSKKNKESGREPPVIVAEEESTTVTTETVTENVTTYPEYPVAVPEVRKQNTGDFYEAEDTDFPKALRVEKKKDNFSGEGYLTGFPSGGSASVVFRVNAPSNQHYDLSFNIASENETECRILLNGKQLTTFKTIKGGKFNQITVHGVFLVKGSSEITVSPVKGNICLDCLKLSDSAALGSISYDAKGIPSNENAGKAARELMSFISDCYGKYIITGQYASDENNSELDLIYRTTGKYPVIRCSNLSVPRGSYDDSYKDVEACADWYRNGGIPCVSWFWNAPSEKSSFRTAETDFRLSAAMTDIDISMLSQEDIRGLYGEGKISDECYSLILDIDSMAGQLTSLKNKGVPVLWRPLPEGSGDWYWWGADGADAYKWLWKLLYDRLSGYFELDNLIWIWNGQSENTMVDSSSYDIAAVDIYHSGEKDYGSSYYENFAAVQKFAGSEKPIALAECGSVPDVDSAYRDNALWSFFGLWFGEYVEDENGEYSEKHTSRDRLIKTYNSEGSLTLDEYRELRSRKDIPEITVQTEKVSEPTAAVTDAPTPTETASETGTEG